MKKILLFAFCGLLFVASAHAFQLTSQRELGTGDAKNQNVTVKCTTDTGKVSTQTCSFRRFAKCSTASNGKKTCNGWHPWKDLRNPGPEFSDWKAAATACCRAKGLR